jgi:hypothetical protein
MKKLILIMMCIAIAIPSYSKTDELEVSGSFISKSNVRFEISIINDDNSKVVVQTKSSTFKYNIKLKLGNKYLVRFIKDDVVKELYVTADKGGLMEIDVDFTNENAAQLCYNETHDNYHLTLLYQNK